MELGLWSEEKDSYPVLQREVCVWDAQTSVCVCV